MSSGLDMPQLSTTACAGSYSHPSPSVVPETPDANISYSQQILPVLPSSSVPQIVPSNTSTSLIQGTPAAIGLFRARKSLTMLPPYTSPFPYHNYTLNFTVRSPVPTQNMLVQTEKVSTEDGGEGERVGEAEEEDEERVERDEAKLVLEVARVQRKVCRAKQQLSIARIKETNALGNLYRFRAEDAERKLNHAEFDLGHTQVHELGYTECSKSYVFHGGKEYALKQIQDMLGLSSPARAACHPGQPMPQQALGAAWFLLPMQQVEFQLTGILESLQRDPWPIVNDKHPFDAPESL
ncbi:hypothetical protein PISMIDRAFT_17581 [Pisolithus microcarpus 441]|uniref:Protein transport protein SEC23 n=1 Tax=Pisolithus microcarpus 441 TaxID=765257 RepID=A0A0C9XNQ4_9AGAM|nr:hypothetical protein PISMIDRAFT_17581 [Pisolithus microcarpus 441]